MAAPPHERPHHCRADVAFSSHYAPASFPSARGVTVLQDDAFRFESLEAAREEVWSRVEIGSGKDKVRLELLVEADKVAALKEVDASADVDGRETTNSDERLATDTMSGATIPDPKASAVPVAPAKPSTVSAKLKPADLPPRTDGMREIDSVDLLNALIRKHQEALPKERDDMLRGIFTAIRNDLPAVAPSPEVLSALRKLWELSALGRGEPFLTPHQTYDGGHGHAMLTQWLPVCSTAIQTIDALVTREIDDHVLRVSAQSSLRNGSGFAGPNAIPQILSVAAHDAAMVFTAFIWNLLYYSSSSTRLPAKRGGGMPTSLNERSRFLVSTASVFVKILHCTVSQSPPDYKRAMGEQQAASSPTSSASFGQMAAPPSPETPKTKNRIHDPTTAVSRLTLSVRCMNGLAHCLRLAKAWGVSTLFSRNLTRSSGSEAPSKRQLGGKTVGPPPSSFLLCRAIMNCCRPQTFAPCPTDKQRDMLTSAPTTASSSSFKKAFDTLALECQTHALSLLTAFLCAWEVSVPEVLSSMGKMSLQTSPSVTNEKSGKKGKDKVSAPKTAKNTKNFGTKMSVVGVIAADDGADATLRGFAAGAFEAIARASSRDRGFGLARQAVSERPSDILLCTEIAAVDALEFMENHFALAAAKESSSSPSASAQRKPKTPRKGNRRGEQTKQFNMRVSLAVLNAFAIVVWVDMDAIAHSGKAEGDKIMAMRSQVGLVSAAEKFEMLKKCVKCALHCLSADDENARLSEDEALTLLATSTGGISAMLSSHEQNMANNLFRTPHDWHQLARILQAAHAKSYPTRQTALRDDLRLIVLTMLGHVLSLIPSDSPVMARLNDNGLVLRAVLKMLFDTVTGKGDSGLSSAKHKYRNSRVSVHSREWGVFIIMRLAQVHDTSLFCATVTDREAEQMLYMLAEKADSYITSPDYVARCASFAIMQGLWFDTALRRRFVDLGAPALLITALARDSRLHHGASTWGRRCAVLGALNVIIRDDQSAFLDAGGLSCCLALLWKGITDANRNGEDERAHASAEAKRKHERWEVGQELLMVALHSMCSRSAETARRMIAIISNEDDEDQKEESGHQSEGALLEQVCGYRSIFYVLFRVASPEFTPRSRTLAARSIRSLQTLLMSPYNTPTADAETATAHGPPSEGHETEEGAFKKRAKKVLELSPSYDVNDELRAVAGEHAIVRLAVDFANEWPGIDPEEDVRMDGAIVLAEKAMLSHTQKEILRQCGGGRGARGAGCGRKAWRMARRARGRRCT